jgi:hypothetical protein
MADEMMRNSCFPAVQKALQQSRRNAYDDRLAKLRRKLPNGRTEAQGAVREIMRRWKSECMCEGYCSCREEAVLFKFHELMQILRVRILSVKDYLRESKSLGDVTWRTDWRYLEVHGDARRAGELQAVLKEYAKAAAEVIADGKRHKTNVTYNWSLETLEQDLVEAHKEVDDTLLR